MSDDRRNRRRRFGLSWQGTLGERRPPSERGVDEDAEPQTRWPRALSPARRRAERQEREERQRPPRPAGGDAPEPPQRVRGRWRLLALALAVVEVAAIAFACTSPLFQVQQIDVQGAHREPAQQVVAASGVSPGTSIFLVSGAAVRSRLDGTVWIRSSTVSPVLPSRVQISVEEWQPVAVYAPKRGGRLFVDSQGNVLGSASPQTGGLPLIDGPRTGTQPGQEAIDPRLLTPLVNIDEGLPGLIGQSVVRFQLDSCWNLTMIAGKGWRTLFGRMLTPSDYTTLQEKVAALHSVASQVDFNDPTVYVNVMNPSVVAIGHGNDVPPTPTPSPTPSASPTPSPSASPSHSPSPSPSPSPSSPVRALSPSPAPSASPSARPSGSASPTVSPSPAGACS